MLVGFLISFFGGSILIRRIMFEFVFWFFRNGIFYRDYVMWIYRFNSILFIRMMGDFFIVWRVLLLCFL